MKFLRRRKFNIRINKEYNNYKKVDKVNGITFKKALDKLYDNFNKELSKKEFDSFLKYRYDFLRNAYKVTYNFAITLITAFVPAACIELFNKEMFDNINGKRII